MTAERRERERGSESRREHQLCRLDQLCCFDQLCSILIADGRPTHRWCSRRCVSFPACGGMVAEEVSSRVLINSRVIAGGRGGRGRW